MPAENRLFANLEVSPRSKLFRAVEKILRDDPKVKGMVGLWRTLDGTQADKLPVPKGRSVDLGMAPGDGGSDEWYSPEAHVEDYPIAILIQVDSTCIDDAENAWWAIERAFYPHNNPTQAEKVRQQLVAAGAETGQPLFQRPVWGDHENGCFVALGMIKIRLVMTLNP